MFQVTDKIILKKAKKVQYHGRTYNEQKLPLKLKK